MDILIAILHLRLHKGLSRCQFGVPCLQLVKDTINCRIWYISPIGALHVQRLSLLVESALEQVIVDAIDDFVLQLSDVLHSKHLHH